MGQVTGCNDHGPLRRSSSLQNAQGGVEPRLFGRIVAALYERLESATQHRHQLALPLTQHVVQPNHRQLNGVLSAMMELRAERRFGPQGPGNLVNQTVRRGNHPPGRGVFLMSEGEPGSAHVVGAKDNHQFCFPDGGSRLFPDTSVNGSSAVVIDVRAHQAAYLAVRSAGLLVRLIRVGHVRVQRGLQRIRVRRIAPPGQRGCAHGGSAELTQRAGIRLGEAIVVQQQSLIQLGQHLL